MRRIYLHSVSRCSASPNAALRDRWRRGPTSVTNSCQNQFLVSIARLEQRDVADAGPSLRALPKITIGKASFLDGSARKASLLAQDQRSVAFPLVQAISV